MTINDYEKELVHIEPAYEDMRPLFIPEPRMMIAAMAMQGILANGQNNSAGFIAKKAVALADALINELNKENNDTDSNK